MLGIVLCGGQSTRMGSDKGLLKLDAKTWAQTAIDKLDVLNIAIKISLNNNQYPEYSTVFSADNLITDDTSLPLRGPLQALLSIHIQYPTEDLLILACDMLMMEPSLLKELEEQYKQYPAKDAYIFVKDGEPEPLCGIYTAKGLSSILAMLHNGELVKHSMKFMLEHLSVHSIVVKEEQKKYFQNFNAHAELNGL